MAREARLVLQPNLYGRRAGRNDDRLRVDGSLAVAIECQQVVAGLAEVVHFVYIIFIF